MSSEKDGTKKTPLPNNTKKESAPSNFFRANRFHIVLNPDE